MLTWKAPGSNGGSVIINYKVYRGIASGNEILHSTLGNMLAWNDTGLTNGQIYYYKISAVNNVGEGLNSSEKSATPATQPGTPQILQAIGVDGQVMLTWEAPVSNGGLPVTNYAIYRGTSSGAEALLTTVGNVLDWNNTGLTNGQINYYEISAVNGVGEGGKSSEKSAIPATIPGAPQNLQATGVDSQVTLTWEAPVSNGGLPITNYTIFRGTSPGAETLLTTVGNVFTWTDTGLMNGQIYYYKVSAINSAGVSPQSSEEHASPIALIAPPNQSLLIIFIIIAACDAGTVIVVIVYKKYPAISKRK